MDKTPLYYTFSTIAQVLAAFIALSGVFILFKIQELKKIQLTQVQYFLRYLDKIPRFFKGDFHNCPSFAADLKELYESECLQGMNLEMEKISKNSELKDCEIKEINKMKIIFNNVNNKRSFIINLGKISIIFRILTIIFSLAIIPFVPCIDAVSSIILYRIIFLGLTISIITMGITIFKSFKEINYLKAN